MSVITMKHLPLGLLIFIIGIMIGVKMMIPQSEAQSWQQVLAKTQDDGEKKIKDFSQGKLKIYDVQMDKVIEVERTYQDPDAWQKKLTKLEFDVNFHEGTERPFNNEYDDNKKKGVYRSKISGRDLFHSDDKFDSGTGWPSFTQPVNSNNIILKADNSIFGKRIEVIDATSGAHLGHVFPDGPAPTGLRYCINSAALEFVEGVEYKQPKE